VQKFKTWFEKAKQKDAGFGIGRFAADPTDDESSDDGDLDI
jgi:hypothetical protein